MNTLHSGVENEGLNTPSHPMIAGISKAVLIAITALMAAGCNGKASTGFGVINETAKCLKEEMSSVLAEKCATEDGRNELYAFVIKGGCEKIPELDKELSFGGNKGTTSTFIEKGVFSACEKEE